MDNEQQQIITIRPQKGFQEAFSATSVDVVFGGGILGGGKLQPLDSKILTKKGWVRNGDLKIGDKVLTPFDGEANVIALFPQGEQDVYELTTSDGRKCECGLDHLWTIRTKKQKTKYSLHRDRWDWTTTLTTADIIKGMQECKSRKYYIPLPKALEFEEKELVIPPYALGIMLGDGCLTLYKYGKHCIPISTAEDYIVSKFAEVTDTSKITIQKGSYTKNFYSPHADEYWKYLQEKGLDTYSYNKYIPEEYLFSSIEQRRQLLYGLMDTDGSIDKKNAYSYSTTSERLKDDIVALCRSLGYIATVVKDNRSEKYTSGVAYDINIHTDDIIFTSDKHWRRYDKDYNSTRNFSRTNDHAYITSITKTRRTECQCLLLDDNKHLYVTDDYITTHNSYALVLAFAEPLMTDPNFRCLISRKSLSNLKAGGGFVEKFKAIFGGDYIRVKESDNPRITFPNGTFCDLTYIDDSNMSKLRERAKGWEYDAIAIDELTEMSWECFSYVSTRNRGASKTFTGKFFATLNPKRSHWTRKFLDWYIRPDGFINPEREGKIRYFYVTGAKVEDVVWGNTKEEVYLKCKIDIDRKLKAIGGNFSYENMIKSFTFYQGKLSENKAMLDNNPDYIGSVAMSGGKMSQALLEGNFNVDPETDEELPITSEMARSAFESDPQVNGDLWITIDLADYGTDNMLMLAWNGFHVTNIKIVMKSTPRDNAIYAKRFAKELGVDESHIIYDATSGRYFQDYIPEAMPYLSSQAPRGIYQLQGMKMKDVCYLRLVRMLKRGGLTFDESVAKETYKHQNLKYTVTVEDEFKEECAVVRFDEVQSGKKALWNKKKMNQMLGRGRSMDLLDPCAMRMLPCLDMQYGSELDEGFKLIQEYEQQEKEGYQSIYDETTWY